MSLRFCAAGAVPEKPDQPGPSEKERRIGMNPTRSLKLCVPFLCLALAATPALARSSRDGFSGSGQRKLGPDLFLAINGGDLAGVHSLLARGADPNARNGLEDTPLLNAAAFGQIPMVSSLLDIEERTG